MITVPMPTFIVQPAEWRNGWTEEDARAHCEDAIQKRDTINNCNDVQGVDVSGSVDECVEDILVRLGKCAPTEPKI